MSQLLPDQLRLMAEHFPDEQGYLDVSTGDHVTFDQWNRRSNRLAHHLIGLGVEKGDRVALYVAPDHPLTWIVAYAAIHKAGAVAVPTNTRLVPRELEYVLGHAGAVAAVVADAAALEGVSLPDLRHLVVGIDHGARDDDVQVPVDGGDMADLMYTSGTTGRPKGVVVRHGNVAMLPNGVPMWTGNGWLHASPMFTFAGIASVYNPMKLGMRGMYMPKFDAGRYLDVVEDERPTATFIVPAMAQLLLAHPRFDEADLSSLGMVSLGSAPVAPETIRRLRQRLPDAMITNGWGMTEAGPAFCYTPPEEIDRRIGSVGRPMPPTEFRIVDDDGVDLPPNEPGELLVRNPGKEREYYNEPEATAGMWREGWLHSGDIAYLDDDGYLYIVGRKKDVIIRGGNNVHATDVEGVLFEHPAVQEAAVAAIPHDVLGEDVGAWIVLRPGATATVEELIGWCRERLADYKVPRRVTFVAALPRNATGKVVKRELA